VLGALTLTGGGEGEVEKISSRLVGTAEGDPVPGPGCGVPVAGEGAPTAVYGHGKQRSKILHPRCT